MENRHPLYDARNTVTLSRPGRANREKRRQMAAGDRENPLKLMTYEPKVAMTSVCRFCGMDQGGESRAICRFCITCQFCGLVPSSSRTCEFCGNHDLDKKKSKRRRVRAHERLQDAPKKPGRNVRRIGPQRRSRRGRRVDEEI